MDGNVKLEIEKETFISCELALAFSTVKKRRVSTLFLFIEKIIVI